MSNHSTQVWFHTSLFYETCQYTIQNVLQSCLAAEGFEDIRTFLFAPSFRIISQQSLAIRAAKIQFTEHRLKRFVKRYWLCAADSSHRNLANFLRGGRHPLVGSLPAGSRINVMAHNRGNSNYKENFTLSWKGSSNTRQSLGHFMLAQHDEWSGIDVNKK